MDQMTQALRDLAGRRMKTLLAKLTTNRFKAVFTGAFVTMVIQSSSVTTVLVVGFVSAGLLALGQAIGIILGADIGTTVTAQIIAFNVTKYALILVAFGFAAMVLPKQKKSQRYGAMIMGLGLIFFGMELMSSATFPLRTYAPFIDLMRHLDNPLLGILIGTLFTAIIQSSSATMGIIIVLAAQGFVTLEAGIALALGANIGTAVTAILASLGKPPDAVRAAVAHVLFKVIGVFLWFGLISQLALLVRWISPAAPESLTGTAKLAVEAPRQIANAHTVFNVVNTFIFIWFITPFARFLNYLIPDRPEKVTEVAQPKYLDHNVLSTPELALDRVRLELGRLGQFTADLLRAAFYSVCYGGKDDITLLKEMDDDIDALYSHIVTYLGQLSHETLSAQYSDRLAHYLAVANYLENIGDMVEMNMVEVGKARLSLNVYISQPTQDLLKGLHNQVLWAVEASVQALVTPDIELAKQVIEAKSKIGQSAQRVETHLAHRLVAEEPNRFDTFRLESEMIEYLKRIYYFAKRIAKIVADIDPIDSQIELQPSPMVNGTGSIK
ncbi:MAG: Na/Pi cotransporter family protein [Anaerolineae bacterium]|nr:Na/Pi cotransporter family protein [Anaerolineae bacterium]